MLIFFYYKTNFAEVESDLRALQDSKAGMTCNLVATESKTETECYPLWQFLKFILLYSCFTAKHTLCTRMYKVISWIYDIISIRAS